MNIRPIPAHCWPHEDLPGAGPLDEHELHAACLAKTVIRITPEQAADMDECADWSHRQRAQCVGTCETADGCSCCGGECLTPQACQQPDLTAEHTRQRRSIAVVLMAVGAVLAAVCITAYLRAPT